MVAQKAPSVENSWTTTQHRAQRLLVLQMVQTKSKVYMVSILLMLSYIFRIFLCMRVLHQYKLESMWLLNHGDPISIGKSAKMAETCFY